MNKKTLVTSLLAGFGGALGIGLLAFLEQEFTGITVIMAPLGATAVLVFALPSSPLAQPRNVIVGHLLTATVGVLFVEFTDVNALTLALASGIAIAAMLLTNTTHPPAGANPILVMTTSQSWMFLVSPVLLGACLIVAVALTYKYVVVKILSEEKGPK